jgi:hypothetical protein
MKNSVGSGIKFADWAVVILAIVLYFKTAEVLAYFAPQSLNNLIGTDVSWIYGLVTAFFIEGVALAYHFYPGARVYTPAIVVKWILIVISGICQVFDAKIVTGVLNGMTDAQKFFFMYGIPLLPWFVLILLFFVGEIPNATERKPWRGMKNYLPDPKAFWEGKNSEFSPNRVVQANIDVDQVEQTELTKAPNGKEKTTANPTSR